MALVFRQAFDRGEAEDGGKAGRGSDTTYKVAYSLYLHLRYFLKFLEDDGANLFWFSAECY